MLASNFLLFWQHQYKNSHKGTPTFYDFTKRNHKRLYVVEDNGIEPLTPCLQSRCSPSWANPPLKSFSALLKSPDFQEPSSSRQKAMPHTWVCKWPDNAEMRRLLAIWWVWMDSNHRPPPYQDGALTSWATDPVKVAINAAIAMLANLFWCCYCRTTDKCECLQSRFFSLERRWSSRTFRYGYLVTTSPQSWILPW